MQTTIRLKTVILTCLIGWLAQTEVKAQTATVVGGYPVIDLTALPSYTLTLAEANSRRAEMYTYTPASDALLTGSLAVSGHSGTWNTKMSARFQVMRNDLGGTGATMTWVDAWNGCKTYSEEGGGAGTWRLPTQRELHLIWALHPQLIGKGSFVAFDADSYCSSTESNAISLGVCNFGTGYAYGYSKTSTCLVRCIRDI